MEETGQVKTGFGECNLNVTRPDSDCSKILVSNPVTLVQKFMRACEKKLDGSTVEVLFIMNMKPKLIILYPSIQNFKCNFIVQIDFGIKRFSNMMCQ